MIRATRRIRGMSLFFLLMRVLLVLTFVPILSTWLPRVSGF